jgi:hypothetical protein
MRGHPPPPLFCEWRALFLADLLGKAQRSSRFFRCNKGAISVQLRCMQRVAAEGAVHLIPQYMGMRGPICDFASPSMILHAVGKPLANPYRRERPEARQGCPYARHAKVYKLPEQQCSSRAVAAIEYPDEKARCHRCEFPIAYLYASRYTALRRPKLLAWRPAPANHGAARGLSRRSTKV